MKMLCAQVVKDILGDDIDVSFFAQDLACLDKTSRSNLPRENEIGELSFFVLLLQYAKVYKLTADAKFGTCRL